MRKKKKPKETAYAEYVKLLKQEIAWLRKVKAEHNYDYYELERTPANAAFIRRQRSVFEDGIAQLRKELRELRTKPT